MPRLLLIVLASVLAANAQTLDEIVNLSLAARGGADKLRAMQSQRLKGTITSGADKGSLQVEIQRPASIREEFNFGNETVTRMSDGVHGWVVAGRNPGKELEAADIRNLTNSADLDGPLLDYAAKGTTIELAGTAEIGGRKHFKLAVLQKNGVERTDYIDAKTFLETKWEGKINIGDKEVRVASVFSDYRSVDGIAVAFRIDSQTEGFDEKQIIILESAEINLKFDPAHFRKPSQ